jgi:hypothetical protein
MDVSIAPPLNKQVVGSFLALDESEPCLLPPASHGGEERKRVALATIGLGRRGSSLVSVRIIEGRPSPSSLPSAPLPLVVAARG